MPGLSRRLCLVAAAAGLLVAVGGADRAVAQSTTPVTFSLDFRALGRHAAWYVALDKGYYKQAGLNVTIIPSQGTAQSIQNLEAGVAQFAFSDVAGLVEARANAAATAKMVAVIYQKAPYAIYSLRSGANVTEPRQLEGLEIGSGAGSFTQKVIQAFMVEKGLDPGKVHFTNIDPAARVSMLASKRVPAIETFIMSRPGIDKAAGANQVDTFLLADHGLQLYSNGILVKADYMKAHPDLVKAFVKASLLGWRDTIANPEMAADTILKYVKGLDRGVALQEIKIVDGLVDTPETKEKGLGYIDPAIMQKSIDLILRTTKGGKMTVADVSDPHFLPSPPVKP